MRIAAGVLLIIASLFNGCAGFGYLAGGAIVGGAGVLGEEVQKEMKKGLEEDAAKAESPEEAAAAAEAAALIADAEDDLDQAKKAGAGLLVFGVFLFVMLGLQIAGGVVCFTQKAPVFIMVVAALTILTEGIGFAITGFNPVANILGVVAAIFAFIAASQIRQAASTPAYPDTPVG